MRTFKVFLFSIIFMPAFLFSMGILLSGCGQDAPVEEEQVVRPVKYIEINPNSTGANIEYSGKITAVQEVFMAFEVSGKINAFFVKEGQRVKKGTVLSKLDPRDFQTALDSRMADLNATKADYERARELYENNTISKRDLDVARRNYEVSKAGVNAAKKSLGDTKLVAPFSGIVAKTLVENYQNIQAKQSILILQDDTSLEMVVDIPEQDYAKVDQNMSLSEMTNILKPEIVVSSFPGKQFAASFQEASATADPVTRTFEVTLGFTPPSDISVLPGMTARLVITGSMQDDSTKIIVPAKAIFSDDDNQSRVWLIDQSSNTVKSHGVVIGTLSGETIVIRQGLKAGDIIAGSGVHQLRDGMHVRRYEKP